MKRTANHLLTHFSSELTLQGVQSDQLESFVQNGFDEAKSFGIMHEHDLRLYVECMVVLHPRFAWAQDMPCFGEILRREDLSGSDKMDLIHDHLVFGLYKERPE